MRVSLACSQAFGAAVVGSTVPVVVGIGIGVGMGFGVASAFACGVVLAPTSLGIILSLLQASGLLNTPTGQLVITAAAFDDVIGLVLLSMLEAVEGKRC